MNLDELIRDLPTARRLLRAGAPVLITHRGEPMARACLPAGTVPASFAHLPVWTAGRRSIWAPIRRGVPVALTHYGTPTIILVPLLESSMSSALLPLRDLADPCVFLVGAWLPLVEPARPDAVWACVNGSLYERIGGSYEEHSEYDDETDESIPSRAALRVLALDLTHQAVIAHVRARLAARYLPRDDADPEAMRAAILHHLGKGA